MDYRPSYSSIILPLHNGVSGVGKRTLLDWFDYDESKQTLQKSFWDYALETAVRILNMVLTKKGCEALVKRDTLTKPDKLEPRSIKCIFIGYPKETMGYSFYYPPENKVLVARNAEFLENSLINQEASGSLEDLEIIQEEDTHPSINTSLNHEEDDLEIDESQSDIIPIRRSTRTRRTTDRMCLYIDAEEHELRDLGKPANHKAALLDPESDKWLNAMNVEMQSMKDNEVWILVKLPPNGKTVGSKWLFKKKTDMDGAVHTYKARLVAKGYTQTPGIDYEETFSPVADIRAIRILIAIAAYYDYEIWQMDVKTAFLNGYLNEEVYMEQPEGFVNPKYPNRVCKLKRSIYGLKQASRQWNKRFDDEIKNLVSVKMLMSHVIPMLQDIKSYPGKCFAMKDLGEAAYILGIKIYRNSKRGSIPMQDKLRLSKSQGASIPAELKHMQSVPYASAVGSIMNTKDMFLVYGSDLKRELRVSSYTDAGYLTDADDLKSQTGYVFVLNGGAIDWKSAKQSIFSTSSAKVEYIAAFDASKEAIWVRKFISGLVQQLCLYMHDPREPHLNAMKRVLRYLRGTTDLGLQLLRSTTSQLIAYSDADWAGCPATRRSTSGYCVFLGDNLLTWSSKRQDTLSRSSAEAEYRGVANAVAETSWIRNLLRELHTPLFTATLVYCDNVSAVYMSANPVQHQRTKHIEIDIHFVRDKVAAGHVRVLHVPSRFYGRGVSEGCASDAVAIGLFKSSVFPEAERGASTDYADFHACKQKKGISYSNSKMKGDIDNC
ncbi:retrotransposon protein, putative, ty1-copia subclass [Tanacetum coccineum]